MSSPTNPPLRSTPVFDLAVGLVALAALALALQVGLSVAFRWPAIAVAVYLVMAWRVHRSWPDRRGFGWANRVTLARAALVALLIGALTTPSLLSSHATLMAGLAFAVIGLDGLDGWIARVSNGATAFGARFDMEVDALLILVLSIAVVMAGQGGWWVLAIGAMRYVFVAAGALLPWLKRELPESTARKAVCVAQGLVLAGVLLPWVAPPITEVLLAAALVALVASFARDVRWLARARDDEIFASPR